MNIRTSVAAVAALALPMIVAPPAQASQRVLAPPMTAPPGYTELQVGPPAGGTVYVYEGHRLLGRFDRAGSMLVPSGRDYRVVATRGDTQLWSGDVTAAGAPLSLDWSQPQRARQPFPPPAFGADVPLGWGHSENTGPLLSTASFRSLLRAMDDARDDQPRLDMVADAAGRYTLTTSQAAFILGRFRSDAYRLAALDKMRDRLLDRDDGSSLLDRFRNPSARRFARDLLSE